MAVEDTASVSEGEAVAALTSSLTLSPRREPSAALSPAAPAASTDRPLTVGSMVREREREEAEVAVGSGTGKSARREEDQAELLEAAGLDPEALAALPPDMRREVLEQEARSRRMREASSGGAGASAAPADPSRAAEMDNASIVATLPPELRREVLLSADEALLSTLPPNLVAEAMVLRERIPHQ
ncbi:unnamed protein product, partial [Hapterophycus canaliculatus]